MNASINRFTVSRGQAAARASWGEVGHLLAVLDELQ
jgi:hypothetical protein